MFLESRSPVDDRLICRREPHSDDTVDALLAAAHRAQRAWADRDVQDRVACLVPLAEHLLTHEEALARRMVEEVGKPVTAARAELRKCALLARHTALNAPLWLRPRTATTEAHRAYVAFEPLGVIAAIMPWNFPWWQVLRCALPTLAAGNAVVLKHAENVAGCALDIEAALHASGVPRDLFRTLLIDKSRMGRVLSNPVVRGAALTGSVRAGRAVAASMGALLKPVVLELGGSDPAVVLADADIDHAARVCVASRMQNNGQTCIAAKRWIVEDAVREPFTVAVMSRLSRISTSDPMDDNCQLGPMARPDLRDTLHDQVRRSVAAGATLRLGGTVPDGPGAWYPATLLDDVGPGMAAYSEELFGPVACLLPARDEADAVRIANDTAFGLGASVFTADRDRGEQVARQLNAGACFVNHMVASDPRLPFGGTRDSGLGRELGPEGVRAFTNTKTVWVS